MDNELSKVSDLIALNGYHFEFDTQGAVRDVYLNLSVNTANIGADKGSPLEFTAQLRAVEIEASTDLLSPLKIHPRTTPPTKTQTMTVTNAAGQEASAEVEANGGTGMLGKMKAKLTGKSSQSDTLQYQQDVYKTDVTKRSPKKRQVKITPQLFETFEGDVFNEDNDFVLASIKDTRSQERIDRDVANNVQPMVTIKVMFQRKNLVITIGKIHDGEKLRELERLSESRTDTYAQDRRKAAAECFLRDLMLEHLTQTPFWRDNTQIVLAEQEAESIGPQDD